MKILVVDDDPVIGLLVNDFLTAYGHDIEVINSGSECLAKLQTDQPDMLILDLVMPEMSGIDVLEKIRTDGATEKLPVIMLSANDDTDTLLEQYGFGADHYVEKPFNVKKLLEIINNHKSNS